MHRQEVDSGKTEEEMYAAVVRPQTTSADPRTPQVSPGQSSVEGKPQREGILAVDILTFTFYSIELSNGLFCNHLNCSPPTGITALPDFLPQVKCIFFHSEL